MKKPAVIFFNILLLMHFSLMANVISGSSQINGGQHDNLTINGGGDLKKTKILHDLIINGSSLVEESQIGGNLEVNGLLIIKDSNANNLNVNGELLAENIQVATKMSIHGRCEAKNSHFHQVELDSLLVKLENCIADGITVNKDMKGEEQVIEVRGESKIQKIVFESGKGIVKKSEIAFINAIEGGTVQSLQ